MFEPLPACIRLGWSVKPNARLGLAEHGGGQSVCSETQLPGVALDGLGGRFSLLLCDAVREAPALLVVGLIAEVMSALHVDGSAAPVGSEIGAIELL
jgi:hypothetical protein